MVSEVGLRELRITRVRYVYGSRTYIIGTQTFPPEN